MRIKAVEMLNWLCFEGEHRLDLDAKAYAVIARDVRNPERSNWRGKSGFLEGPRFALFGTHRHRLDDAWITTGAKEGGFHLHLEDGTIVSRTRKRGKATQLTVSGAKKEDAQRVIEELLGLTERDFLATCYFEQGEMSRFVTQEASKRTEIVSAWFQLDPLIALEELHKTKLSELTWNATTIRQALQATDDLERSELSGFASFDALIEERQNLTVKLKKTKQALDVARTKLDDNRKAVANDLKREQYAKIVEEGTQLRTMVDQLDGEQLKENLAVLSTKHKEASNTLLLARMDLQQKRQLVTGSFDGVCPVAGIACPAKNEINTRHKANKDLHETARIKFEDATDKDTDATRVYDDAATHVRTFERASARLEMLREQGNKLLEDIDEDLQSDNAAPTQETIDRLLTQTQDMTGKLAVYERSIAAIEKARGERLRLAQSLSGLETTITTEREAKVIVGRSGAQRRIAEGALKRIEHGANAMLRDCGIDLTVAVEWSREGTTIANACEECGHPFPKTARVKNCERCEAPRGMNIINKLNISLSNTSGAAKDLAGAAFQLSASNWMRNHRKARWSVAELDEPFGQLDAANRKAFSQHLAALLRSRYGFEQSFTVAHHAAVLDALPGRIEIEGDGERSTIRVAA